MSAQPLWMAASYRVALLLLLPVLTLSACAPLPAEHKFSVPVGPPAIELSGELFRPEGAGPFPAVILLHGSEGLAPRYTRGREFYTDMAEWIRSQGYIAFLVDSFSSRQLPYEGFGISVMRPVERRAGCGAAGLGVDERGRGH